MLCSSQASLSRGCRPACTHSRRVWSPCPRLLLGAHPAARRAARCRPRQVKEMLTPFGQLKAFNLVMDRGTGNSKVGQQGPGGRRRGS